MVKSVLTSKIAKFHFKAAFKVTSLIDMEGGGGGLSLTLDGKATLKPSSSGTTNCTANNFCYWLRLFFIMVFGIFHLKVQHF